MAMPSWAAAARIAGGDAADPRFLRQRHRRAGGYAINFAVATMDGSARCRGWKPLPPPLPSPYIDRTQVEKRRRVAALARGRRHTMAIESRHPRQSRTDATLAGETATDSLLDAIDCTVTSAGYRACLAQRLPRRLPIVPGDRRGGFDAISGLRC